MKRFVITVTMVAIAACWGSLSCAQGLADQPIVDQVSLESTGSSALVLAPDPGESQPSVLQASQPSGGTASCQGCASPCGDCLDCRCDPMWVVRGDAIFLRRSTPSAAVLVTDSFIPGGNVLLDASQFNFDTRAGWDIYLARNRLFGPWGIEASFFSVEGWNAVVDPVLSPGGAVVQFAVPLGNVFFPANVSGSYASRLYNVEINARRPLNDWLTLLAGFRYVDLSEQGLTITQDIGPGVNTGVYSINARNYMPGFQLGLEGLIPVTRRLSLGATGKAGILSNQASNDVNITQTIGPSFACAAAQTHAAFVGQLDFAAQYSVAKNLNIRAGYQLLWLDGVATAVQQVGVSDPANEVGGINTGNGVFYNGAFVGLEYRR